MGKSGKNKKAQASKMRTQFPAMSDDDLLDQAVSENKAAAALAKTEVDMGNMGDECPTKQELLAVLDNIILFDLRSGEPGKGGQPCISSAGDWVFYCDENDAIAAMEAHKEENPGALVAVGCTPLGRAFALSEGKAFGFQSSMAHPMRIQGSTAVLEAIGEADAKLLCPQALAQQMNEKTSTIPMFSLEELHEPSMLPFFFTRIDMIDYWTAKTGKPESKVPKKLMMTDLRVLITRMMSIPNDWKKIKIVPTTSSIEWLQAVTTNQKAANEEAKAAAEAKAAEIASGDAPPPLS